MRQTLFTVSYDYGDVRIFGFGLLLAIWGIVAVAVIVNSIRRNGWGKETVGYLPVLAIVGAAIVWLPKLLPEALPIRGYGVMMLVGIVSGVGLAWYRARQMGIDPELILSLAFWMVISGIFGARVFYVFQKWDSIYAPVFADKSLAEFLFAMINVSQGGLVVYGSLISVSLAFVVFVFKYKIPGLALADLIAPSMMIGLAFGRVGCLMNGCCFGGQCDLPWQVTFPWGSPPHVQQAQKGELYLHGLKFSDDPDSPPLISEVLAGSQADQAGLKEGDQIIAITGSPANDEKNDGAASRPRLFSPDHLKTTRDVQLALLQIHGQETRLAITTRDSLREKSWVLPSAPRSAPVHPTQIYSALNALWISLFLWVFYAFRTRDGQVIAMMLTIYPIARFLLEEIRKDEAGVLGTPFTISQCVSFAIFFFAIGLWIYLAKSRRGTAWPISAEAGI